MADRTNYEARHYPDIFILPLLFPL